MTTSNPDIIQSLHRSYSKEMPITTSGLCTKEPTDPDSDAQNWTPKLSRKDASFFQGHRLETHDKTHAPTKELLTPIHANWQVVSRSLERPDINRVYPKVQHWYESGTNDHLGQFGNIREPLHPENFINYFREFCQASEKEISMDVIGFDSSSKKLYAASKLTNYSSKLEHVGDKTDHWMISSVDYMRPKSIQTFVWHNELICTNGMTKKVEEQSMYLSQRKQRTFDDIAPYLSLALEECSAYDELKDRLIHTPINNDIAFNVIRKFFRDEEGLKHPSQESTLLNVRKLEQMWLMDCKDDNEATRQGNAFRLQQCFTQWTSHGRKAKSDDYRFSQKLGGSLMRMDNRATELIREAVEV
tara:strand:- start:425 stop:1498 length:1074 start_codon:yes stop_codon:yes gene_type:complete